MALILLNEAVHAEPGDFLLVEGGKVTVISAETARVLARAMAAPPSPGSRRAERMPGWGDITPTTEALIRQKAADPLGDPHWFVLRRLWLDEEWWTSQSLVEALNTTGFPVPNTALHSDVLYPLMGRQLIERRRFQQQGGDRSKWEYRITALGREFLTKETA